LIVKAFYGIMKKVLMMKGKNMNKYFKTTLLLALPLAFLLGCSKQSSTTSNSSKAETSEVKTTEAETTEKKPELKTVTFVNDSQPGVQSTLTYTVDGDNVVKQTAHNVADPEALNNTADDLKNLIEETYKGYKGLKGVTLSVEIKDGKVVQDLEIDLSVASLDELRKALPEEYSGVGKNVSFKASKKMLTEHGYKEQTN
jgi:putative lipoprotein